MNKLFTFLFFTSLTFTLFSQSFHKRYQTNTKNKLSAVPQENDMIIYGNRAYLLTSDSASRQIHKLDLSGNPIWSKTYTISNSTASMLMVPNNGLIHLMRTGATTLFGIDTLNGSVTYSNYLNPCPPNPQNSSDRHVVLDNGNVVKIGCDMATLKTTIFTLNGVTGASISAVSINHPTQLGAIGSARITKSGPNSILLYGRSSLGLVFFCKINNTTTLASDGIHILNKAFPADAGAEIATSYNGSSNKIVVLFRNGTDFYFVKTDTSLSTFNAYHRTTGTNMVSEISLQQNNIYIASNNIINTNRSIPLFEKLDLSFNTIQSIQFPIISSGNHPLITSIHQSRTFKVFPTSSYIYYSYTERDSLNARYVHLVKDNFNELNTCAPNGTLSSYNYINLSDSLQVAFTNSLSTNTFFGNGNAAITNTLSITQTVNCITTNLSLENTNELEHLKIASLNASKFQLLTGKSNLDQITVYDITGKIITEMDSRGITNPIIDLLGFNKGIYFIKVVSNNNQKTFKIINH